MGGMCYKKYEVRRKCSVFPKCYESIQSSFCSFIIDSGNALDYQRVRKCLHMANQNIPISQASSKFYVKFAPCCYRNSLTNFKGFG